MLNCVKDIALTLAAFSSIYVGLTGLETWKRQLKGDTEYQLLKNACIALYELRELIKKVYRPKVKPATLDESDKKYDIAKQCRILT